MSDKNSNSHDSANPVLVAVINWCCIIEVLLFVMFLILIVWVEDYWLIIKLMVTDMLLFWATWFLSVAYKYFSENLD